MAFKKGNTKPAGSGRKKGSVNKLTSSVKGTVLDVFNTLQQDPKHSLLAFAKKNPRDFYNIASKLIPNEVEGTVEFLTSPVINVSPKRG